EDAASVFAYHVYFGLPFPALVDHGSRAVTWPEHGPIGPISSRYGVGGVSTFYVIGPDCRSAGRSAREQPDKLLRRELGGAARGRGGVVDPVRRGTRLFREGGGRGGPWGTGEKPERPADKAVRRANGRRIVRLFRPYWGPLSIVMGLIVVSSALGVVSPFLL